RPKADCSAQEDSGKNSAQRKKKTGIEPQSRRERTFIRTRTRQREKRQSAPRPRGLKKRQESPQIIAVRSVRVLSCASTSLRRGSAFPRLHPAAVARFCRARTRARAPRL